MTTPAMHETGASDKGLAAEHPEGTASATQTATLPHHASNTSGLEKEARVTSDTVISPNALVGELPPETPSSSNVISETTLAGDEKSRASDDAASDGAIAEKTGSESNEKDGVAKGEEETEDEFKYPGGVALTLLTLGLCLSCFVVALDNTIIATAIPRITTVFNSLNDVGWYGSSYLLTTTSLQPSFGKVYTYFNVKWTFLTALCIFELGSTICAAARNSVMLIVGRAIAGAGAAGIFSGGMTIVGYAVPLRKRAIYISLLSSTFGISSIVGPILGGALTDKASWRWCFWINLPVGGAALLTVAFFFKNPARKHSNLTLKQKLQEMDLPGAFVLICSIVCLLLALQWGGSTYPWHNSKVWGCLLGFGLLISVFIFLQFRGGDRATIPLRILKQRTVASCTSLTCFMSMGLYTHIFYLPFYFQAVKGTSAEGSGIRTIPYLVSSTLASIAIGGSVTVFGWYTPFMWFGAAVFTVGAGLLHTLKVDANAGRWIGYQILTGVGTGAAIQIPFIAVQVVLSAKDMPSGNALTIFFNTLGGAIAVSIAQNIFANTLLRELPLLTQNVNPATIIAAGATHVREVTPPEQLGGVLESYDRAIARAFVLPIVMGGIAWACSLFVEWKSVKGKKLIAAGGA